MEKLNLDFKNLSDEAAKKILRENGIGLTPNEARQVQDLLGRPPTLTEAIVWGIQGSEHCSYKSSRKYLKTLPVNAPNVMLGVGEDAGIVHFAKAANGHSYGIIMAHESHNHPSQIVPYEGAATGVGGIVRDVIVMGGRPIASADPLRFGDIERPLTKRIADEVVEGIAGYGNPLGVPNIAGDTYFDSGFNDNCLVNVVALGALREDEIIHSYVPKDAEAYDIIIVGKPTDSSGMGGAAFASLELAEEDKEANKGAVQEPNPFLERHLIESTVDLFRILKADGNLDKVGFKDMGAGGNICATVELVEQAGLGADIDLRLVHTSMDLHPSVIACAETQERLCWMCHPSLTATILNHYNETWDLPGVSKGARASVVGKVKKGNYTVRYGDEILVDAAAADITRGVLADREVREPKRHFEEPDFEMPDLQNMFSRLLKSENIASRLPIFERYDKVVQGQTLIESGMADAGVVLPFLHRTEAPDIHAVGAALSVDACPSYALISPYWAAVNAVVESMRNVVAVGATPWAATDCLNYGNPEKPEQMWEMVEGIRGIKDALEGVGHLDFEGPVPIVSGNVSLYNESKNGSVPPSPIIGMLGRLENSDKAIMMQFKKAGSLLILLGERKDECGGGEYYRLLGHQGANVPKPDFKSVRAELRLALDAIDAKIVLSAHDISEGGLALCLAEMAAGGRGKGRLGAKVDIGEIVDKSNLREDKVLFSQSGGFILEIEEKNAEKFQQFANAAGVVYFNLGKTLEAELFTIESNGESLINMPLPVLIDSWLNALRTKLK